MQFDCFVLSLFSHVLFLGCSGSVVSTELLNPVVVSTSVGD